jgi:NitT/TauT family transport system permease protein
MVDTAAMTSPRPKKNSYYGFGSRIIGDGLILLAVAGWWYLSLGLPEFVMPSPQAVGKSLLNLFVDPRQLVHVAMSSARVVASVVVAVVLGSALAFLPRRWPVMRMVIDEGVRPILNSFPSVGWAILAVIWFNVSNLTVVFIEVAILTPFCLINMDEGLKEIDLELTEMGHSFTRNKRRVLFRITLPLLAPYLMGAVRMAYGVGWKLSLVAELFGATTGLGFLMLQAQTVGDAATVFATCFAIVILFVAGERLLIDPLDRLLKPAK